VAREEPEVETQCFALWGGQRLVRLDQPSVVIEEPGGLLLGAHGVPAVPNLLVRLLAGQRGAVAGGDEVAERDLGPAAQVREDLRE
jgi:hypothetical protein